MPIDDPASHKNGGANREPEWFRQQRRARAHDQDVALFNLREDPGQTTNLAANAPERVISMRRLLDRYKRDGRSVSSRLNSGPQLGHVPRKEAGQPRGQIDELHLGYLQASFEGSLRYAHSRLMTSGGAVVALPGQSRVLSPHGLGATKAASSI